MKKDSKNSLKDIVDGESNNAEGVTQEIIAIPESLLDVERLFVRELSDALIYLCGCERKVDD